MAPAGQSVLPATMASGLPTGVLLATSDLSGNLLGPSHGWIATQTDGPFRPTGASDTPTPGPAVRSTTTTSLNSSANPSAFGQPVTFTATVHDPNNGPASGEVEFRIRFDLAGLIPEQTFQATLKNGQATSPAATLELAGTYTIRATYLGNGTLAPSADILMQTVNPPVGTTTSLSASANPAVAGQYLTFTAAVTAHDKSTPTGSVTFLIEPYSTPITVPLVKGKATFSTSILAVGRHIIAAYYNADPAFQKSNTAIQEIVNKATTTTSLNSAVNPSVYGQAVTFTATVSTNAPGAVLPGGTVQFQIDGENFGKPVPVILKNGVAIGVATSPIVGSLFVGSHTVQAVYSGNGNLQPSTGTLTHGQLVNKAGTTTTVPFSPVPVSPGTMTVSATVTANAPGSGTPSGKVQFKIDGKDVGTGDVNASGQAVSPLLTLGPGTHMVQAFYQGSANYSPSDGSAPLYIQVPTSTTITSSVNPSDPGQVVTFTATVTSNGPNVPTGTVSFTDGTSPLGMATLNAMGQASFTTGGLFVGKQTITASYLGDPKSLGSRGTMTQTVRSSADQIDVYSSANPSVFGQGVTFTATVRVTAIGLPGPSGNVQFEIDGIKFGMPVPLTGSTANSPPVYGLAVGRHSVEAVYSGDTNFTSSHGVLTQTVNPSSSKTSLGSSLNPSNLGQPVTFTATVAGPYATPIGGNVQFQIDGSNFGAPVPLSGGVAQSLSTTSLSAGSHTIQAIYSGDASFVPSTGTLSQTVNPPMATPPIVLGITPAQGPASGGTLVAITGSHLGYTTRVFFGSNAASSFTIDSDTKITALAPAGMAGMSVDVTVITPQGTSATNSADRFTYQSIAPTTTALTSSANPSFPGQPVTLTATVTSASGMPTGTVQFVIDGNAFGAPVPLNQGVASSSAIPTLSAGNHTIQAVYSGDANFGTSTGSLAQLVLSPMTTTMLTASMNPSPFGQSVTFTATVTVNLGGPAYGGTVQFLIDGMNFGSPVALPAYSSMGSNFGIAVSGPTATLAVGNHSIQAMYSSNNANLLGSTGTLTQIVNAVATSTTLTSSANPSFLGQDVTFTASVTAATSGSARPTGQVAFVEHLANGSVVSLGTAPLDSTGKAVFHKSDLSVGSHAITAEYQGDGNFMASDSASLTQIVNAPSAPPPGNAPKEPQEPGIGSVDLVANASGRKLLDATDAYFATLFQLSHHGATDALSDEPRTSMQ